MGLALQRVAGTGDALFQPVQLRRRLSASRAMVSWAPCTTRVSRSPTAAAASACGSGLADRSIEP